jgi:hypothetical protein
MPESPNEQDSASPVRNYFQNQAELIRKAEFALAVGAALVALGAGGDMFITVIALSLSLVFAFVGLAGSRLSSWGKVWSATAIIALLLTVEGGVLFWHFHALLEPSAISPSASVPQVASPPNKDAPLSTAFIDCHLSSWPAEGETNVDTVSVQLGMLDYNEGPIAAVGGGPIVREHHNQRYSSIDPIKCEITFYGTSQIFNVQFDLPVDVYERTQTAPDKQTAGKLIKTAFAHIILKQPVNSSAVFYVFAENLDAVMRVRAPDEYQFVDESSDGVKRGRFIASTMMSFHTLFPYPDPAHMTEVGIHR